MPHYRDGTEAKVGDLVRGKGYNVKGPDGQLKEIVGEVIQLTPGASACNVVVACVTVEEMRGLGLSSMEVRNGFPFTRAGGGPPLRIQAFTEYGQADHFEKIG